MSDHIFVCINRKCKLYRKERVFATSVDAKCKCGRIMRYLGEQGNLFEDAKDITHAVFSVEDSKRSFGDCKTICHMEYVCLKGGMTRGAAIPFLTKYVSTYHRTSKVKFMFWADSYVGSGPTPLYITMQNNKVKEDK